MTGACAGYTYDVIVARGRSMSSWEIWFGIIAIWIFVVLTFVAAAKTGEALAVVISIFMALYFTNSLLQLLPPRNGNDGAKGNEADGEKDDQPPSDR